MDKKSLNDRLQRQEIEWRKERDQLISRATDIELEIKVRLLIENKHCNSVGSNHWWMGTGGTEETGPI